MIRLISVFAFLSLLVVGYNYSLRGTQTNVVIQSGDRPCAPFIDDSEMYETCRAVWAFERAHASDVQIILD